VIHPSFRVLVAALLLLLAGCQRAADAPKDAPAGMTVTPGDGLVLVEWIQDPDPNLTYWIFFQAGGAVTAAGSGVPLIRSAQSPRIVFNLANGIQYAFVMNATYKDSPAGPTTPVMTQTPRLAGATWDFSGTPMAGTTQDLNGIAFNGSRFVAVGNAGSIFAGDYNYASAGPPGVTAWTPVTSVWWASQLTGVNQDFSAVIFTGTRFAALAADGSILASTDGFTWTLAGTVPAGGASMNGIALGTVSGVAVYVAVGSGGATFASSDLISWTPGVTNPANSNDLFGVAFLNGGFVATGANGTLLTSSNGVDWNTQVSGTTNALRSAAFGLSVAAGFRYVAVGDGTIVTSPDAATWTPVSPPPTSNLRSVTFGSRFLAVGGAAGQGAVAYSDDGINWSQLTTGSLGLNRVIFAPGMYVAVGASGANAVAK
jgi:hypothetical protein